MRESVKVNLIKEFFKHEDFRIFADAIPHALLIINSDKKVVFANHTMQTACFKETTDLTPFLPYEELIHPLYKEITASINSAYAHHQDTQRQVTIEDRTYLLECNAIYKAERFHGTAVSLTDITEPALKQKQHELLYQMSTALGGISNTTQILRIAVQQVLKSLNISSANIMLLHRKTGTLVIHFDSNRTATSKKSRSFKLGEGLAGKAAAEQKVYSAYDISESELYAQKAAKDKGALLVIPISSKGNLIGVLNLCHNEPRYFTEDEVQFLTILANEVAIAIDNARLYSKLNRKIKLLSELFKLSSLVGVSVMDTRIQQFVSLTADLLDAEDCCVYIYPPGTSKLLLKYQKNAGTTLPLQIDARKPSITSRVFTTQQTSITNETRSYTEGLEFDKRIIQSVISSPIVINGKPIGVIHVFNKHGSDFDEEDKNLLSITANRIGTKIENAQLIRKVESEKELLDKIIENTTEGVAVLNRKRKVIIWNKYLEELTGLNSTEVVGQPCYRVLYNRLRLKQLTEYIYAPFDAKKKPEARFCEIDLRTKDGEKVWIRAIYSHILDQNKHIENTIIVFQNISREKELIEAKNEFVSLTTHELRTPLTAIKGYLSMILRGDAGDITTKQREYFTKAYNSTERLVDLVEDLLEVVRLEENRMTFTYEPFTINTVIEETVEIFTPTAATKNITLHFDATAQLTVKADRIRTKEIIENLVENAIKYTRNRGSIKISLEKREHDVLISVKDTGVGIPAKYLTSVFDRFVRIPNALSVKAGGTGLGLYIVKNLVEKQGGTIWATSHPGKDTTFHFTLPLARSSTDPQSEPVPSHQLHAKQS